MAIAVLVSRMPGGRHVVEAALLTNAADETDGEWVQISGVGPFTVDLSGITGDTVDLRGSGAQDRPANDDDGYLIGTAKTANGLWHIDAAAYKWVKARVTIYGSGTINAWFHGVL